ncbi:protein Spindly isoform X1 [Fukomys damarensis]|uniref:protein Spindly isoform X1 n=1 Tax=Fukomys damarensis TaxID=885580 RepID=UPI0008FED0B0|nr:protein Spindly isoform X1 [Fukomys damarensis]XP_019062779.1 protein Spindly isoform X1 [Fukomys damarensis]XP_019062780.1 protein Spindly isoform X1 [Fukomys damarensis]XP_019062781.1 protein Spindly isoform X1 [Fukomys damarensis]XP_019062782.1 protein Spindly isoform X1 [Fukomys damarensis]XP_019062783.1 protein Spindly isoform X1 [Fukomys damarensis]XP_019062784.1 protein Spindly isoform X1 [Fukomys damarensis]XP_019062785.1 protein Spindly isoform X1 [Fukomys damarensis]
MEADVIADLRSKLKEVEKERLTAAQYGLQLLESQNELQNQLDKYRNEMMTLTENYEQEKYTLQREVELKSRMLESLTCECEAIKQQQKVQLEQLEEQLSRSHGQEMNELKNKLEKLKAELDEARLSEKQLKHKVDHQKELLAHKSEEIRIMSERVHESMSSEMLALQIELTEMESLKTTLKEEVNELQYRQEQLESLSNNLMRQVDRLKGEKEEREREVVSYYNALEKARVENQDLQVQLNQALQQALDPNSKGNSLFAEVEDRRAAMERQLISMKVKYQSLKKQNAFNREQMQRMKLQISTLLQMKGSQTEFEQQERLFAMLEQKNGEIKHLLGEMRNLEKFKNLYESMESKASMPSSSGVQEDRTYYTDLLQLKLDNLNKENESTKGELSIQRMKALFESQRALDIERKLFANERCLQLSESENMKLRAKLDELKLKYELEEKTEVPVLKKRREVLPMDVTIPKDVCSNDTDGEGVSRFPPQKDEARSCPNNLEDANLQLEKPVSTNTPIASFSPHTNLPMEMQLKKEKKCVKLIDEPADAEALSERSGNTPHSPRSVSSFPQGNWPTSPPLLSRCMNYAVCFFIYLLSIACSVIPQFHLPAFNFSRTLRKTKMIARGKDS